MDFRRIGLVIVISGLVAPVAAQQTSSEQALGKKLMQEIQASLNCSAELIGVQAELAKAQARIKELEAREKPAEK